MIKIPFVKVSAIIFTKKNLLESFLDKALLPKQRGLFSKETKPQGKKFISDDMYKKAGDEIIDQFSKTLTGEGGKFTLDAKDLKNLGIIGAGYVQKGIYDFADWSKAMLKEYPDFKDNLKEIWEHVKENYKDLFPEEEEESDIKDKMLNLLEKIRHFNMKKIFPKIIEQSQKYVWIIILIIIILSYLDIRDRLDRVIDSINYSHERTGR